MELAKIPVEGLDEAFHVLDFLAIDLGDNEIAQTFVSDGGICWDRAVEENDAIHLAFVFFGILHGIEEIQRGAALPVLAISL